MTDPLDDRYLAILGAVGFETDPLLNQLEVARSFPLLDGAFHSGSYNGRSVIIGSTGMGKVNAAIITATLLDRFSVGMVWNVGCAGCFEEGPLEVGDVLVTSTTILGDEGVLTREGTFSATSIGIPVLKDGETEYYDHIPLDRQSVVERTMQVTPEGLYRYTGGVAVVVHASGRECANSTQGGAPLESPAGIFRLRYGPSLTVGMVSGDKAVAHNRFLRYGAWAENMEGGAVAQACFRFGVPMVECRGISNTVGNRNKTDWRFDEAVSHCHGIILNWLIHPRAAGP